MPLLSALYFLDSAFGLFSWLWCGKIVVWEKYFLALGPEFIALTFRHKFALGIWPQKKLPHLCSRLTNKVKGHSLPLTGLRMKSEWTIKSGTPLKPIDLSSSYNSSGRLSRPEGARQAISRIEGFQAKKCFTLSFYRQDSTESRTT